MLTELHNLCKEEELYWLKRSHEKWLLEGDNNTEYYHSVANGRRRKNTIFSLQNGEDTVQGDEQLLQHVTGFYKELFGPASGKLFPLNPHLWSDHENISEEDNTVLT